MKNIILYIVFITFTISSVFANNAPIPKDDIFSIKKNTIVTLDVLSNDTDADWDVLQISTLWMLSHGLARIPRTGTWIIFTPDADFVWETRFVYTVTDGEFSNMWVIKVLVEDNFDDYSSDISDDWVMFRKNYSAVAMKNAYESKIHTLNVNFAWKIATSQKYSILKSKYQWEYHDKLKMIAKQEVIYPFLGTHKIEEYNKKQLDTFWPRLSKLSDQQITLLVDKVDKLLAESNEDNNYTADNHSQINTILRSFRALAISYMNDSSSIIDIDELFE